jgi:hypothetical protein
VAINDSLLHYRQHRNNAVGFVPVSNHGGITRSLLRSFSHVRDRDMNIGKRKYMVGALTGRATAANARVVMTEKILSRLPEDRAQNLRPKLQYYQDYAGYLSARLLAYERPTRAQRVAAMLSALSSGRYKNGGRNGARDVGADLLYGVMGRSVAPDQ